MATIIPCNLIEQESDRLLQIFRSCYTLTGTDMDDLVNLAYSASLCGTGEGTIPTFDQNNIFTYISAISSDSTNISPVDAINTRDAFSVDEKEIIIYIHRYYTESSFKSSIVADYYFIRTGKGNYGVGGTVLDSNSMFKIRGHVVADVPSSPGTTLPPRILSLFASTVGGATINTPHTILNGQGYTVTIQDIEDTYFVIYDSKTAHNTYNLYRFTGTAGVYGSGPDTSVLGDFLLVDSIVDASITPDISNGQIKVREINIPAVIGTTGITDIADAVNLSPFKGAINVAKNEILMLVVDRLENTKRVGVKTLTTEKWLWNKGEYNDIGNASTINDYYRIETIGNTLVDGTAQINNPEIYYTTWKDLSSTTAAAAAINVLSGLNRVIKNDNLVLVRIADDIGGSNYKVWEFIGANGTYGVSGLTAVAGDFNPIPLVDSVDLLVRAAAVPTATTIYYEDNVTTLGATDVQIAIEKLNTAITGVSSGSPFKEITTGNPNYLESTDAYRSARLGLGSTILPTEMLHLVSAQSLAKGGVKVDYTYTSGGIQRSQLGGQALYSELGVIANSVEGFNNEYFANTTDYVDNIRSYVRGGDYSGDGDTKSLTSGLGIISSTKDRYGRIHIEPHTTNDDKDWLVHLQALNEDSDFAEVVARSKGTTAGFLLESQLDFYSDNTEGDSSRMFISPHIMTFDNLTQLSGYGSGTFVTGYTHTDTLAKTGVAATTLGTPVYSLNVDSNGNIVENTFQTAFETIDEGNGLGFVVANRTAANYGNIGFRAKDFSYYDVPSTVGATGQDSFAANYGTTASGQHASAFGDRTIASDLYAFAIGQLSIASGRAAFAQGLSTASGSGGAAALCNSTASGEAAFSAGLKTTASSWAETSLGIYPTTYVAVGISTFNSADRIFNIGNGTGSGSESDALTVLKSGSITAPSLTETIIAAESTGKVLVTREFLDNRINTIVVNLTAADIKTLGSVPITVIAAHGVGTIIKVRDFVANLTWNSVAFDANNLILKTVGAIDSTPIANVIGQSADTIQGEIQSLTNTLVENAAVQLTGVDSVAVGDSTMDVYITYEVLQK